jgi:hypothetical protein
MPQDRAVRPPIRLGFAGSGAPSLRSPRSCDPRYGGLVNSDDHDLAPRLRAICLTLPEVTERASHGVPAWFVRDKRSFAQLWADGHHDNDFPHLWCAGLPGAQEALIGSAPDRFFRPPYVGHRGWLGVRLDGDVDWTELAELCADAYRAVAPAKLLALLDAD